MMVIQTITALATPVCRILAYVRAGLTAAQVEHHAPGVGVELLSNDERCAFLARYRDGLRDAWRPLCALGQSKKDDCGRDATQIT